MRLSERGAIRSAIADGGFHLYPAGRLMVPIQAGLPGDALRGDFDPAATAEKVARVAGPEDPAARGIFEKDRSLLCERLRSMAPDYDIESVFDRTMAAVPEMARRYYGLEGFEAPRPRIVEYFFEGFSEAYKDSDWSAFNVNRAESREMGIPVGVYFKRDQVSPGLSEFVALHEANHAMQEATYLKGDLHAYIPWMDEGLADALGRMMLFRATGDERLLAKVKRFRTEVEVCDPWKVSYHFNEGIAAMLLLRGRLPFARALMQARRRDPFAIDWGLLACKIKEGWDPHIAVVAAHRCAKPDVFRKRLERDEATFRKESDLDQSDLRTLQMFLSAQTPSCLTPAEYAAALWFTGEVAKRPCPHPVDPHAIPSELRPKLPGWSEDALIPWMEVPAAIHEKAPELEVKIVIREGDVPEGMRPAAEGLSAKYFILKRGIGGTAAFEPYGGGLPYRMATGEIRCTY